MTRLFTSREVKRLPSIYFLAYRNFLSSHRFVLSPDDKLFCFGDTLGNVREAYKSFPALLFFNRVDWMKSLLDPVFIYCEGYIGTRNIRLMILVCIRYPVSR